ncbi:MAG: zinc ribbon domain-containing protein [Lachnospiraceae bacterium]|nr:zinc ribbon domain-containing protein [Lachnospiraceae bacterium]
MDQNNFNQQPQQPIQPQQTYQAPYGVPPMPRTSNLLTLVNVNRLAAALMFILFFIPTMTIKISDELSGLAALFGGEEEVSELKSHMSSLFFMIDKEDLGGKFIFFGIMMLLFPIALCVIDFVRTLNVKIRGIVQTVIAGLMLLFEILEISNLKSFCAKNSMGLATVSINFFFILEILITICAILASVMIIITNDNGDIKAAFAKFSAPRAPYAPYAQQPVQPQQPYAAQPTPVAPQAPAQAVCKNCGTPVTGKFCSKCGTPVE